MDYIDLNDDWISNFEKTDKLYEDFYRDNLYYINLKFIYINRGNEIEKINQETFLMSNHNLITREEILQILKKSCQNNEINYSLLSILRYNNTLEVDEIKNFISYPSNDRNFLTIIKNIDAITFEKTINMFHDLNDLILIFNEKSHELKKKNPEVCTKKIYIHENSHKKTIKKRSRGVWSMLGALVGAMVGAVVDAALVVGAMVGALVGAMVGAALVVGAWVGTRVLGC
jgi:hypothetical protein